MWWCLALLVAESEPVGMTRADVRVDALLEGLVAYERTVERAAWSQETYVPPTSMMKRPAWLRMESSARYADERWRWYMDISMFATDPPDYRAVYHRSIQFGDGGVRYAAGENNGWKGVANAVDGFFIGGCTFETLRGRWLEYGNVQQSRSLPELIAIARRIDYLEPTQDQPFPGLLAVGALGDGYTSIEARLDPESGFMPVFIRTFRAHDGADCEVIRVLDTELVEGIRVASIGVRESWNFQLIGRDEPLVPGVVMQDFAASQELTGLQGRLSSSVAESLRRSLRHAQDVRQVGTDGDRRIVTGPLSWRNKEYGPITPVVTFVSNVRLNADMTYAQMFGSVPAEGSYITAYSEDRRSKGACEQEFLDWTGSPEGTRQ